MRDTSPEIEEKMREMIRNKTPQERLVMGCSMHDFSKGLVLRALLENNSKLSQSDIRRELFLKFYGNDFTPSQQEKILAHLTQLS